jgi:hypothetical protein
MMQIILENRDRFSDKNGQPLPFVMDLHNYVMSTQDSREKATEKKAKASPKEAKKPKAEPIKIIGDEDDKEYAFDAYPFFNGQEYGPVSAYTRDEAIEKAKEYIKSNGLAGEEWVIRVQKQKRGKYEPTTIKTPDGKTISAYTPKPKGAEGKRPASLKGNIHTILHGNNKEKEELKGQFFHMADTPDFVKELGISGEYFSVRYGVISRHTGKDDDHNLSEEAWEGLCDAITDPFAIAKHGEGYRFFTSVKLGEKYIAVGVDVKNIGQGIDVNSVSTAFGYTEGQKTEEIIYRAKKMTAEQAALLDGLNSLSLPPVQGLSKLSPESGEKSSDFDKIREKYQSARSLLHFSRQGSSKRILSGKITS